MFPQRACVRALPQHADVDSVVGSVGRLQPQSVAVSAQPPARTNHSTTHEPIRGGPAPFSVSHDGKNQQRGCDFLQSYLSWTGCSTW